MKITNKYDLPAPLVSAISNDQYDKVGDISITGLIKPPRMRWLEIRHDDEIVVDASELIWRLIGSVGHAILERADTDNHLAEERLTMPVLGWVISGKSDLLAPDMTLDDYKFTSVWAVKHEKTEWTQQCNAYAWLYKNAVGFEPKRLRITAILRDWSKPKAARDQPDSYPPVGVVVREVPLWSEKKQFEYIEDRVMRHQVSDSFSDMMLPFCTDEERWAKPDTWAVKKKGAKKAMRGGLHDHPLKADAFIRDNELPGQNLEIEFRPGNKTVRCDHYCDVKNFCNQYKALKSAAPAESENAA